MQVDPITHANRLDEGSPVAGTGPRRFFTVKLKNIDGNPLYYPVYLLRCRIDEQSNHRYKRRQVAHHRQGARLAPNRISWFNAALLAGFALYLLWEGIERLGLG